MLLLVILYLLQRLTFCSGATSCTIPDGPPLESSPGGCFLTLTLHTSHASWSDARQVCEVNGGQLVTMAFYAHLCLRHYTVGHATSTGRIWTGVYNSTPGSLTYTWGDCGTLNWADWAGGQSPQPAQYPSCVTAEVSLSVWSAQVCHDILPFVCEEWEWRANRTCSFQSQLLQCVWDADHQYMADIDADQCRQICMGKPRCWGFISGLFQVSPDTASYEVNNIDPGCTLIITNAAKTCRWQVDKPYTAEVRLCYDFTEDNSPKSVSTVPDVPLKVCSQVTGAGTAEPSTISTTMTTTTVPTTPLTTTKSALSTPSPPRTMSQFSNSPTEAHKITTFDTIDAISAVTTAYSSELTPQTVRAEPLTAPALISSTVTTAFSTKLTASLVTAETFTMPLISSPSTALMPVTTLAPTATALTTHAMASSTTTQTPFTTSSSTHVSTAMYVEMTINTEMPTPVPSSDTDLIPNSTPDTKKTTSASDTGLIHTSPQHEPPPQQTCSQKTDSACAHTMSTESTTTSGSLPASVPQLTTTFQIFPSFTAFLSTMEHMSTSITQSTPPQTLSTEQPPTTATATSASQATLEGGSTATQQETGVTTVTENLTTDESTPLIATPLNTLTSIPLLLLTVPNILVPGTMAANMTTKPSHLTTNARQKLCKCHCPSASSGITAEQDGQTLHTTLAEAKATLSSTRRKLESAPDPRASARYTGYVGVAVIVTVVLGIVSVDVQKLIIHIINRRRLGAISSV